MTKTRKGTKRRKEERRRGEARGEARRAKGQEGQRKRSKNPLDYVKVLDKNMITR